MSFKGYITVVTVPSTRTSARRGRPGRPSPESARPPPCRGRPALRVVLHAAHRALAACCTSHGARICCNILCEVSRNALAGMRRLVLRVSCKRRLVARCIRAARHVTRLRIDLGLPRPTCAARVDVYGVAHGTHYVCVAPLRTRRRRSRGACRRVAPGLHVVSFASHSVARRLVPDRTAPPPRTRRGPSPAPTQTARARSAAGLGRT